MALHVPKAPGLAQMLKEGAKHFAGLEEAVYRNISACKEFADTLRSAYGPNGMNKIVINHIDKLFVTNDAATIMKELEVEHPAAKLMVLAAQMQEEEIGDGTNFVVILCGALLEGAEELLRMGLTPSEISRGLQMATKEALTILPNLSCHEVTDWRDTDTVAKAIRAAIMSKQYGNEDFLSQLIAKACVSITPENTSFNVDNIRVCKILGSGLYSSEVVQGMVFKKHAQGSIASKSQAKIAVFTCPIDIGTTESKGTVLIKTADELRNFSSGEETLLEKEMMSLKGAGVDVVVAGGKFGDMALHFLNKLEIMAVQLNSKFDIRRLCKTVGATALPSVTSPLPEELGYADSVYTDEVGETSVVVFKLDGKESRVSTIVVRGSTDNYMDDIERVIDDGVNTFKGLTRNGKMLPGAGAVEVELARRIRTYAENVEGMEQYAIHKFADALEALPKAIAENSGLKKNDVLYKLQSAHDAGQVNVGIDIEGGDESGILDAHESGVWDLLAVKDWGIKYASEAADTVLKVDQIIMAKKAGGPSGKQPTSTDHDD